MRPRRHLVIFLRAPRLGRVKSRLARGIGAVAAQRFYRLVAARLLRRLARDPRWQCHVAVTPDARTRLPRGWDAGARLRRQGRGDLGARMARVFAMLPPGPAVIVGSDIPDLAPRHAVAAFRALGRSRAVFGPAADGGYWLVGWHRRPARPHGFFRGVRWSSEHALADTLATLPRGASIAFLETLEDVDDADSYGRWQARVRRRPWASDAPEGAASARPGCTGDAGCRADGG